MKKTGKKAPVKNRPVTAASKPKKGHSKLDIPEAMDLYRAGESDHEIARKIGVHYTTVHAWRLQNGLPPNIVRWSGTVYRVRSATSGEVLAEGTAASCTMQLGFARRSTFYTMVGRAEKGLSEKYAVERIGRSNG